MTAQHAVDGQIKVFQVAMALGQFKPNPDRPDVLELEDRRSGFVPDEVWRANGRYNLNDS